MRNDSTGAPSLKILLAEDDAETAELIIGRFKSLGHRVLHATNGESGLQLARFETPDIFILDRMLPKLDGLALLKKLRETGIASPALMLTALGQIDDRVEGLDAGADDYLVKPFALSELVARVNALARRHSEASPETRIQVGSILIDLVARTVKRGDRAINLQPREFRLLEELARNADRVVTRKMLLERVWNFHFDPQTNIVETHMSRMRGKLKEGSDTDPVETVRGEGYRLRGDC